MSQRPAFLRLIPIVQIAIDRYRLKFRFVMELGISEGSHPQETTVLDAVQFALDHLSNATNPGCASSSERISCTMRSC